MPTEPILLDAQFLAGRLEFKGVNDARQRQVCKQQGRHSR